MYTNTHAYMHSRTFTHTRRHICMDAHALTNIHRHIGKKHTHSIAMHTFLQMVKGRSVTACVIVQLLKPL